MMMGRRKLNNAGIPTRKGGLWSKATIENILTSECYATGKLETMLDGEAFYIDCPTIISMDTWRKIQEVRQGNRSVSRNRKEDFLCAGLVYQRRYHTPESLPPHCANTTGSQKLDNYVWGFVRRACRDPALLRQAINQKLAWLEAEQLNLELEIERLQKQLDSVILERQRVITLARKEIISEADLALQLASLQFQELGLSKELDEKRLIATAKEPSQLLSDWAARYLSEFREGIESLDVDPAILTSEERQALAEELEAAQYAARFPDDELAALRWAIFEEKRRTVRTLVKRVITSKVEGPEKRKITVVLSLNMPAESLTYGDQSPDYKIPGFEEEISAQEWV